VPGGITCDPDLYIDDGTPQGKINPDYRPPGYEAANAAWKAALEAINTAAATGSLTQQEYETALKIANWDAFNAAQEASIQYTQDVGYTGPSNLGDETGPIVIDPETGDPEPGQDLGDNPEDLGQAPEGWETPD
jgi:hypothetical protein